MAKFGKFRNVDKRRPWENPRQKRARKAMESALIKRNTEIYRVARQVSSWHLMDCGRFDSWPASDIICRQMGPEYCVVVVNAAATKKCPKGLMIFTPNRSRMITRIAEEPVEAVEEKSKKNNAGATVREETWREFFGLRFYRLRCRLREFWAAARFQRVGAWLPADIDRRIL